MANIPISLLPNVQPSGYTPNDLLVIVNNNVTKNTSLSDISSYVFSGYTFTGNTSATCITDLYVTNVYGCSPITFNDDSIFISGITGNSITINDGTSVLINSSTQELKDNLNKLSFNWNSRRFYDTNGIGTLIDIGSQDLYDSSTVPSINWSSRDLYDTIGSPTLNWNSKELYSSIPFNSTSLNWDSRFLIKSDNSITLDWENKILYDYTASTLFVTGKTVTSQIQVTSGASSGYVLISDSQGNGSWQQLSTIFTGNTSATCISNLYVTNLFGCSPINVQNDLILNSVSAGTILDNILVRENSGQVKEIPVSGLPFSNVTGLTFNNGNYNLTIGSDNGSSYTQSLSILSTDMTITGGTYTASTGVVGFVNNSGGTFEVSGFTSGYTDIYLTAGTYNSVLKKLTLTLTNGTPVYVTGFTDTYVTGGTYSAGTLTLGLNDNTTASPITGFTSTDKFVTGGTYSAGTLTLSLNDNTTATPITGFTTGGGGGGIIYDQFNVTIDGQGAVITAGNKTTFTANFSGTVIGWDIYECSSTPLTGSCVIDTWKDTYANYPPTSADTIWLGSKPTLTSQVKNQATSLLIPFSQGDIFTVYVDSATTVQKVTLCIKVQR